VGLGRYLLENGCAMDPWHIQFLFAVSMEPPLFSPISGNRILELIYWSLEDDCHGSYLSTKMQDVDLLIR
jgi:hypothetical protein